MDLSPRLRHRHPSHRALLPSSGAPHPSARARLCHPRAVREAVPDRRAEPEAGQPAPKGRGATACGGLPRAGIQVGQPRGVAHALPHRVARFGRACTADPGERGADQAGREAEEGLEKHV